MTNASYPLNAPAGWAENQWYIAAFSSEVGDGLVARTFLNRRTVLFRDSAGKAHALSGICPHRMMPMELGTLEADRLVCGYHGLEFALTGECVASPTSPKVPDCALTRYPIVEAGPLLWIWLGDPAIAALTPVPDQSVFGIGVPGWWTACVQRVDLKARSQLLVDNLFDLSHLGFVHASLIGRGGIALVEPTVEERDGRLVVVRLFDNQPVDGYHQYLHPHIGDRMTVRLETDLLGVGLINAGSPAWNGASTEAPLLGHMNFIHGITPETENTTHYWSILTRDFRQDDEALSQGLIGQNIAVIDQDITVLEQIEKLLVSGAGLPAEISMKSDLGAMRARLRMIQTIRAEHPSPLAVSAA